jgi:hypothetical protein
MRLDIARALDLAPSAVEIESIISTAAKIQVLYQIFQLIPN